MAKFSEAGNVAGVAGLVGIRSDRFYYAGKVDEDQVTEQWLDLWRAGRWFSALALSNGYVALKGAYELIVNFKPHGDNMQMVCAPLPIAPLGGPAKVVVRADAVVDLSREGGLVEIHRMICGDTGVLVPGDVRLAG